MPQVERHMRRNDDHRMTTPSISHRHARPSRGDMNLHSCSVQTRNAPMSFRQIRAQFISTREMCTFIARQRCSCFFPSPPADGQAMRRQLSGR